MRRLHLPLLVVVWFALSVTVSFGQSVRTINDAESYAVYSAALGSDWHIRSSHPKQLVITSETQVYPDNADVASCLKPAPDRKAELEPLLVAYREANKTPWQLQRRFDISLPYELVKKDSVDALFRGNDPMSGWKEFDKKFPDSHGVMNMSAVAFNEKKTLALLYMGNSCGGLCGGGMYRFLEKKEGKWTEISWPGDTCFWAS